jgi:fumarate reductase flavoprotein subunit
MSLKKIFALVAFLALCIVPPTVRAESASTAPADSFTANKHLAFGPKHTCQDCHGQGKQQVVTGAQCLTCHKSFENVAESTKDMTPNPHENHLTKNDLDCTQCHHGHYSDTVYCASCHTGLTFKRNSTPPTKN